MTVSKVALLPTLGERMKMALDYSGLSVNAMATELEVHPVSASKWLSGRTAVKGMVLRLWADRTGVNEQWLRTGEVPAGATILDECARRDSNSQPSGWESAGARSSDLDVKFWAIVCQAIPDGQLRDRIGVA